MRCMTRRCDAGDREQSDYPCQQWNPASLLQGITSYVLSAHIRREGDDPFPGAADPLPYFWPQLAT
jgi:hypothetical protein